MTPELQALEERVKKLERVENVEFIQTILRRISGAKLTISTGSLTGTTISVRNSADNGSESVADDYDGVIDLTDGFGNVYRLGYYN